MRPGGVAPLAGISTLDRLDLVTTKSNHYSAYRSQAPRGSPIRLTGRTNGEPSHGRLRQGAGRQTARHPAATGAVAARRRAEVGGQVEGSRRRLLRARRPGGDRAEAGRVGRLLRRAGGRTT